MGGRIHGKTGQGGVFNLQCTCEELQELQSGRWSSLCKYTGSTSCCELSLTATSSELNQ